MESEETKKRLSYQASIEQFKAISIGSNSNRTRGRSFQDGDFHSSPSSEKSRHSFTEDSLRAHKRSVSNGSACSFPSLSSTTELDKGIVLFVDKLSEKLYCMICHDIFHDPVITSCGHTFCRSCVLLRKTEHCPVCPNSTLLVVVSNLAVLDQIGELLIHCQYGCMPSTTEEGKYEVNAAGCPVQIKLNSRQYVCALCNTNRKYLENVPNIWITVLTLSCIALSCLYSLMTDIIEESIQVIDGFGIQLSSKARLGKENKFFFDFTSIEGVIINEAITLQRVIFYLVLVINKKTLTQDKKPSESQEATQLITMFKHTLPRLDVIKDIYNEIQPFLKPNINDDLG